MFRFLPKPADPFAPDDGMPLPQSAWPFLSATLVPLWPVIAASLVLSIVGAAIEVWMVGYGGTLVDLLADATPQEFWTTHGGELIVAALVVLFGRSLVVTGREALNDIAFRPRAEAMVRWRVHRHVQQQPVGWFRTDLSGRIANWVRETGTAATGAAYSVIHTLVFVLLYIAGSVWLMASIDARLVLPLALWIVLYLGLMAYVVPRYRRNSAALQEANAVLTGLLVDSYANIDTAKLFADPGEEEREGRRIFADALRRLIGVQRIEVLMNGGMLFLASLLIVGLVGSAIVLWQGGSAPIGVVAVALALSYRITGMGEWLLDAMSSLFGHLGALRQGLKTVAQPLALVDADDATPLRVGGGRISFEGVSHHYGRDDGGLAGLTLEIAAGEKVGLVGRSGAGKSTLVNLILRFFDPESGTIRIDGQDIGRVTQTSLRRQIAMVTQEAALLHRSVRDNIAYGRTDVTEAQIEAAAAQAQADRFIPQLLDRDGRRGYAAHVGERGVTLSGGQRQRIALARAILKNAPILILDEATSALDSEVETAIRDTLYDLMEGKTVIAIAHRLSTIARMDRIVVLEAGRIAEDGTHAALLARDGIYAMLWRQQSDGFIA